MSKSIFGLFLTGKKVKLDSDVDLKKVIQILRDDNIDVKQIQDKEKLHSLFFAEYDTHFLPDSVRSEKFFNEHEFQEITLKDFLHLIDYNKNDKSDKIIKRESNTNIVKDKSVKKTKYIVFEQFNTSKGFKSKHILEFSYIKETKILELSIKNREGKYSILNFTEDDFQKFIKQIG